MTQPPPKQKIYIYFIFVLYGLYIRLFCIYFFMIYFYTSGQKTIVSTLDSLEQLDFYITKRKSHSLIDLI